jgi:hypothetical protein
VPGSLLAKTNDSSSLPITLAKAVKRERSGDDVRNQIIAKSRGKFTWNNASSYIIDRYNSIKNKFDWCFTYAKQR